MEQAEQRRRRSSGINNYYYGGVNKVINLKLSTEQMKSLKEQNVFNGSVGQFIDNVDKIIDGHGKSEF